MNFDKNKTTTIALILMLTFSATVLVLPTASAHDPAWNIPTYAYLTVTPNQIGVGQPVLLTMWLNWYLQTAVGDYGDRFDGYTIEITEPNGSKETLGPYSSDPIGSQWTQYTPTQVGTYTFQFFFPGDTMTGEPVPPTGARGQEYIGDYYEPSQSDIVTLTVQQDQIESYPAIPLPEGYWTRPISGENRDWWKISGNWLSGTAYRDDFAPYTTAPKTAHIMWTRPITFGGLAGGKYGAIPYYDGLSYESKFPTPVIMQGRLYYNEYPGQRYQEDIFLQGYYCVDLRTGETIYWKNATIQAGEILNWESPNQHGTLGYLWDFPDRYGTNEWVLYDAFNGNKLLKLVDIPGGTQVYDDDGSILKYSISGGELTLWNSTRAAWMAMDQTSNHYYNWRPVILDPIDASGGIEWSKPIADVSGSIRYVFPGDRIIGTDADDRLLTPDPWELWALSLKPGEEGKLLWQKTFPGPEGNTTLNLQSVDPDSGIIVMSNREKRQLYAYDYNTGDLKWGPTDSQPAWDYYGINTRSAYGKVFACGYAGILYCYDAQTGNLLWTYESESSQFESPYGEGRYPFDIGLIADGKIIIQSSEHSPTKPFWRGSKLRCVDVNTGDEVWTFPFFMSNDPLIADGYLVALNVYDNQIYCFGKGLTTTTVSAAPKVVAKGSAIVIEGTVMDQSPGSNNTPAISDQDMTAWMDYMYNQKPIPMDAKGVPVTLDAIDSNGNYVHIDTVTSDMSGMFKKMWTPEIEGEYTIIATFEGSDSYWSSYAETAIGVSPAPSSSAVIEPEPTETQGFALGTTELAIIAVAIIAVVGVVAFWALRKRK
jgi:outer membrane protein assembly factor BamB